MWPVLFIGFMFAVSVASIVLMRRYALTHGLLDQITPRSSHTKITPRGGGLVIVVFFLAALCIITVRGLIERNVFTAFITGGIIVAGVGWLDDIGKVTVRIRLIAHFLAAALALWQLGGVPPVDFGICSIDLGWAGHILGVLAIVWLINLYNFMDGIDGIAAAESVFVAVGGGILLCLGHAYGLAWAAWFLAATVCGFLVLNWPPAKIFMGDVGSGFLGFVFGVLALAGAKEGAMSIWLWIILLGFFLTDATVTLLRRIMCGSRWHEAHRRHAYQHAARRWGHQKVTIGVTLLNLFWLMPLAWVAWRWRSVGFGITLLALGSLTAVVFYFKAGKEEAEPLKTEIS